MGKDAAEQALLADLRDAFGGDLKLLGRSGPRLSGAGVHSSTAFSRALGGPDLPAGSRLGDFEILSELGRGGMGVVYRARQVSLGREVALKVLPGYARYGRTGVERFRAEARAAARLHHTNIVSVYAQGEHDGHFYYAMELIEGIGLDAAIRDRHLAPGNGATQTVPSAKSPADVRSPRRADAEDRRDDSSEPGPWGTWGRVDFRQLASLVAEVADGLEHAHRNGVIHRDVKPQNLLLGVDHRLHLADFGLARLTDDPHLTRSGEVMGTPAYLSPEQIQGHADQIDRRTDVYSLGVTLYELITRKKAFDGESRDQVLNAICTKDPVAPRRINPRLPVDLETICLRAMERDPRRRHPTAALLAEDLRRFSEGRPILSRRVGRLEKAVKWMRRRPAAATAIAALVAVVVLAGGLTLSVRRARHGQATQLVDTAYEQLAYSDYRTPELVKADLERARELGADGVTFHLAQGLVAIGSADNATAIAHIDAALAQDPTDQRALYLRAWAQRSAGDRAGVRATLDLANELGPPTSADAWFFRGLAEHFGNPDQAVESYRQAIAIRRLAHGFYPQAVLHLARARNQQLYKTRSLGSLDEAQASLTELINHKYYEAYPYYLLSISHRLAAEIYRGSSGTRDDARVDDRYQQALDWARRGQDIDPTDDRPITAEAECLESMGLFTEAIEARTRAIETAAEDRKQWEGHHYRWRLYYWTGQPEAALDDLTVCAGYDPKSRFYAHVYPALVHAELGDLESALAHARALADDQPTSAEAALWSATCLRLLGQSAEAERLLADRSDQVDFSAELVPPQTVEWVEALYAHCRVGGSLDALEAMADQVDRPWELWGEACFHAAARTLADGGRSDALEGFTRAYRSFDGERRYTYHAGVIRQKMVPDPHWPPWITLSLD